MDPLSIAAAVITFVEIGIKVRDKVGRVRSNARRVLELTEDIVADLIALRDFYIANQHVLRASIELVKSLDQLRRQLLDVLDDCERLDRHKSVGLRVRFRTWFMTDDIEASILHLRERVRATSSRIHFYASARSEMAISRIEQHVLVLQTTVQSQLRRFDELFTGLTAQGDFIPSEMSKLDDWDLRYIRYKFDQMSEIVSALGNIRLVINGCNKPHFATYSFKPKSTLYRRYWALRDTSQLYELAYSLQVSQPTSKDVGDFTRCLTACSCPEDTRKHYPILVDFCRQMFDQVTALSDDDNLWVVMMSSLYISDRSQLKDDQDIVSIDRALLARRLVRGGVYSSQFHHTKLVAHLSSLAFAYTSAHREEDAILSVNEIIHLIYSGEMPIQFEVFTPVNLKTNDVLNEYIRSVIQTTPFHGFSIDARVVQAYAACLFRCFTVFCTIGRYNDARAIGLVSLEMIQGLQSLSHLLPTDFVLLDDRRERLQEGLSTCFFVHRSVGAFAHAEEEHEGKVEPRIAEIGQEVIEWGVAL